VDLSNNILPLPILVKKNNDPHSIDKLKLMPTKQQVYVCGWSHYLYDSIKLQPLNIPLQQNEEIVKIVGSSYHTIFLTSTFVSSATYSIDTGTMFCIGRVIHFASELSPKISIQKSTGLYKIPIDEKVRDVAVSSQATLWCTIFGKTYIMTDGYKVETLQEALVDTLQHYVVKKVALMDGFALVLTGVLYLLY
jgi:hypothetical protein